jgi:mono/diheme cytochrome c family protein
MRKTRVAALVGVAVVAAATGMAVERSFSEDAANGSGWKAPDAEARKTNPVAADEASLALGKAAFVKSCVMCHGELGKGDGPAAGMFNPQPRDLRDPAIVGQSDGSMYWKLTTGKKPMPAFESLLTEKERWSVVNYLRKLAPRNEAAATAGKPATRAAR